MIYSTFSLRLTAYGLYDSIGKKKEKLKEKKLHFEVLLHCVVQKTTPSELPFIL